MSLLRDIFWYFYRIPPSVLFPDSSAIRLAYFVSNMRYNSENFNFLPWKFQFKLPVVGVPV
jgi:hypothetical protein